jgi:hypothetical protein
MRTGMSAHINQSVVRRKLVNWFIGAATAIMLVAGGRSLPAAETAKPIASAEPADVQALIAQIKRERSEDVGYDKEGAVVSVYLRDQSGTGNKLKLISQLASIKQVSLYGAYLTDEGASTLLGMTNLTTLRVCGNNTNHDMVPAICRLSQLQSLDFVAMSYQPADLPCLAQMTNLTSLRLSNVQLLGDDVLCGLANLIRLKRLFISGHDPDSEIFAKVECLARLVNLEEFSAGEFPEFKDRQLQILGRLPKLKRLDLWGTSLDEEWPEIVRQFPALTKAEVQQEGKTRIWNRTR